MLPLGLNSASTEPQAVPSTVPPPAWGWRGQVLCFTPRERGDATAEQASLVHLVRRQGGPASLFPLCVLYAALSRRLGIPLQLVTLELPPVLRGRGPDYLLRLPASGEQAELYVDLLAGGRLRAAWDLAAFTNSAFGLDKADKDVLRTQMRDFVHEVSPTDFVVALLDELANACEAADRRAEAAFWQIQLDVLEEAILREEGRRRDSGSDAGVGDDDGEAESH